LLLKGRLGWKADVDPLLSFFFLESAQKWRRKKIIPVIHKKLLTTTG
jgi:hypothetical protein